MQDAGCFPALMLSVSPHSSGEVFPCFHAVYFHALLQSISPFHALLKSISPSSCRVFPCSHAVYFHALLQSISPSSCRVFSIPILRHSISLSHGKYFPTIMQSIYPPSCRVFSHNHAKYFPTLMQSISLSPADYSLSFVLASPPLAGQAEVVKNSSRNQPLSVFTIYRSHLTATN